MSNQPVSRDLEVLAILLRLHGLVTSEGFIAKLAGSKKEYSLEDLMLASEKLGFCATGGKTLFEDLALLDLPVIVHMSGEDGFSVLRETSQNHVVLQRATEDSITMGAREFREKWTGYVLAVEKRPTADNFKMRAAGIINIVGIVAAAALLAALGVYMLSCKLNPERSISAVYLGAILTLASAAVGAFKVVGACGTCSRNRVLDYAAPPLITAFYGAWCAGLVSLPAMAVFVYAHFMALRVLSVRCRLCSAIWGASIAVLAIEGYLQFGPMLLLALAVLSLPMVISVVMGLQSRSELFYSHPLARKSPAKFVLAYGVEGCAACNFFAESVLPKLREKLGDTGVHFQRDNVPSGIVAFPTVFVKNGNEVKLFSGAVDLEEIQRVLEL